MWSCIYIVNISVHKLFYLTVTITIHYTIISYSTIKYLTNAISLMITGS